MLPQCMTRGNGLGNALNAIAHLASTDAIPTFKRRDSFLDNFGFLARRKVWPVSKRSVDTKTGSRHGCLITKGRR